MKLTLAKLTTIVIVWRLLLTVFAFIGIRSYEYQPTFPYSSDLLKGSRLLNTWAHFDGIHYLTIINKGYDAAELIQAFFPLYPLLVKYLSFSIFNPVAVGTVVSTVCFIGGLYFLYRLVCLDENPSVAIKVLLLLLVAPTAFFFTSLYTESLFLLLVVTSFYAARTNRWWLAGLLAAFASATRLVGIFMIPALVFEYFLQKRKLGSTESLATLLPLAGIGSYMFYLQQRFNDALLFYNAQKNFGTSRETGKIILLYQVFYRYIKMFLTVPVNDRMYYIVTQEFFSGIFGLAGICVGWFVTRRSYVLFAALAFIAPTLTGTFSSLPRYMLPLFPIYIVIAKLLPRWLFIAVLVISASLLVANLLYFTQGLWVA